MAIGRRKKKDEASTERNPEAAERQRLKRLAFSNGIISETPAKASRRLNPSDTVLKHLGKDIVKKSHRRNKYLLTFPGHIAPIGRGRKIGDLKDLGTKNPVLNVDFPQLLQKNRKYALGSKSKKLFQSSSMTPSKEVLFGNRASLIQAAISTLFKKVEEEAENDDDIEEFSSASKETDGSDEDCVH